MIDTERKALVEDLMCVDRAGVFHSRRPKHTHPVCHKAADLIETQASEIERLRGALIRLRDCDWVITPLDRMDAVRDIARAALAGGTNDAEG